MRPDEVFKIPEGYGGIIVKVLEADLDSFVAFLHNKDLRLSVNLQQKIQDKRSVTYFCILSLDSGILNIEPTSQNIHREYYGDTCLCIDWATGHELAGKK